MELREGAWISDIRSAAVTTLTAPANASQQFKKDYRERGSAMPRSAGVGLTTAYMRSEGGR